MHDNHLELADVFRAGFEQYCRGCGPLPLHYYRVAHAIMNCHTKALGGHVWRCDRCGGERISYNSCRNRHCPSCQAAARAEWVDARTRELLPVPYFHVVFTIPCELNPFALRNKTPFFNILFAAASQTLLELGRDEKRLGAQLGFVTILHTWGQNLMDHPHLHCIVPGGGLDDDQWVAGRSQEYLLPVTVMAALFRGKFLARFRAAIASGDIAMHGQLEPYRDDPELLSRLIDTLYRTDWVVYAKPPFGGPQAVVKYLGRYTHRIAIANSRIRALTETHVTFDYKDYADNNRVKQLTLTITEFIRRFMLHCVPCGFVRIRYYGFLSARTRTVQLQLCRDQLCKDQCAAEESNDPLPAIACRIMRCPHCNTGHMNRIYRIDKPYPGGLRIAHAA
jgi:hypothetical protein